MKILITGSAGFIGFHLAHRLLKYEAENIRVIGIDNINSYYDRSLKISRIKILNNYKYFYFINDDICNDAINTYIENSDIVINLAAQAGVRHSFIKPHDYIHSNIDGFFNILNGCQKHNKKLIYASSSSVYGKNETPWSEDQRIDTPLSLYASTKISNEMLAHSYFNMYKNLDLTGLRFFTVYGSYGRPDMAMWLWTKAIIEGQPVQLFNNGEMYRDFTYVDDIVDGIISCIDKKFEPNSKVFNLGNNKYEKIKKVVSLIADYLNKEPVIEYMPMQLGDIEKTHANINKSKKELGFSPKISIEEGVINFINWYKEYHKI